MTSKDSAVPMQRHRIAPQSGLAFRLNQGQILRVTDVEGGQVSDLFAFAMEDLAESLSAGHTIDYNSKVFLSMGDTLYSNRSSAMFTIVADKVGGHTMLYAPCSQVMFEKTYGTTDPHPNCLDNLADNLEPYGVSAAQITIPLNIFMNIELSSQGDISIRPPESKAGDYIALRAEMDLIVGLTACSAGICNNFTWTPIDVEISAGIGQTSNRR
jgi:uncharacterized protein YcgI (DUF1989 family)